MTVVTMLFSLTPSRSVLNKWPRRVTGGPIRPRGFCGRRGVVQEELGRWNRVVLMVLSPESYSPVQFSSVTHLCPFPCDPLDCNMPGLPVHHQLLEFTQTHVHIVSGAIQPSCPLSSPSPPAFNLSQHQGLFQWVSASHQVAKGLEFQL